MIKKVWTAECDRCGAPLGLEYEDKNMLLGSLREYADWLVDEENSTTVCFECAHGSRKNKIISRNGTVVLEH